MRESLEKELQNAESQIERLQNLLASDFSNKAPAQVVENEKNRLQNFIDAVEKLKSQLATLE